MLAALLLAACEPEATPLPVDIVPTSAPTATPGAALPVRYAMDANVLAAMPDADYAAIAAQADVVVVEPPYDEAVIGSQYDVLLVLGDLPNATTTEQPLTITLAINPAVSPLDDETLATLVRRRLDTAQMAQALGIPGVQAFPNETDSIEAQRTALANYGMPDGFDLTVGTLHAVSTEPLIAMFGAINVDVREAPIPADQEATASQYPLLLFNRQALSSALPDDLPDENVIDLYTIPVSYRADEGISINFTANGWPLATRGS